MSAASATATGLPVLGRRAVVVGGSLAGMLAARAVAPHFDEVLVLERAVFGDAPEPRMSAPQSFHLHVLLKGGENAMERLAPGFLDAIEAGGSERINPGRDFMSASEMGVARHFDTDMVVHGQSRWLLEHCLRERVLALTANLRMQCGVTVRGLVHDADANRVRGLRVQDADGAESRVDADLVVDASGRGEGGIRWLTALGATLPEIEEVKIDFGYASAVVELAPDPERQWKGLVVGNLPREGARGGVIMPIEGGLHICSLGGRAGDYPPDDVEGFVEFTRALPHPALHEALASARFVDGVSRLIYPANRHRHYERLTDLPGGFVPVGDALCSFNPTYGQGMSSSALQAEALFDLFAARGAGDGIEDLVRAHLLNAAEVVRPAWRQANFNDFLYPTTIGDRDMFSEEEMAYRMQVQIAALRDDYVRDMAGAAQNLLVPFERLLEDDVRTRVAAAMAA